MSERAAAAVRAGRGQERLRASVRAGAVLGALAAVASSALALGPDVPYVPTPQVVVEAMLRMARVGPEDFVMDLGSGDGRIVITAAKKFGARGLGVDIDGTLVSAARSEARRQGVAERVEFREQNLHLADLRAATVVTLYLFPRVLAELRPRLLSELRPGARVVSHDFDMGGWEPEEHRTVPVPDKPYGPPSSELYLWVIPANAAGSWRGRAWAAGRTVEYELDLRQTFQMVRGSAWVDGRPARVRSGRVRGEEVHIVLEPEEGQRAPRHELRGRIAGDALSGSVRLAGGASLEWSGQRLRRGRIETGPAQ